MAQVWRVCWPICAPSTTQAAQDTACSTGNARPIMTDLSILSCRAGLKRDIWRYWSVPSPEMSRVTMYKMLSWPKRVNYVSGSKRARVSMSAAAAWAWRVVSTQRCAKCWVKRAWKIWQPLGAIDEISTEDHRTLLDMTCSLQVDDQQGRDGSILLTFCLRLL